MPRGVYAALTWFVLVAVIVSPTAGIKYHLSSCLMTWDQGNNYCRFTGHGLLFVPHNPAEFDAGKHHCHRHSCWIGVRRTVNGSWLWAAVDFKKFFLRWAWREPNNYGGREACVHIKTNKRANDLNCQYRLKVLCAKH